MLFGKPAVPMMYSCHVDGKNCTIHTGVFIAYSHVFHAHSGLWMRVVHIATWQKSVTDYFRHLGGAWFFKNNQLTAYYRYCLDHHAPMLEDCFDPEFQDSLDTPHKVIPYFDKVAGFISCVAMGVSHLLEKYTNCTDLDRIIELVLPFGWSSLQVNLYLFYFHWFKLRLPLDSPGTNGCLSIAFLNDCNRIWKGVNWAPGQRMTISLNQSFTVEQVLNFLKTLRHVTIK